MSLLVHTLALHDFAAIRHLADHPAANWPATTAPRSTGLQAILHATAGRAAPRLMAGGVPNPAPVAPPGLARRVGTLLAWWKWGSLVAGVFGLIACGAMMAIGRRNRSNLAADGASGIPWVLAGLTLIALSSGIVGVFL